MGISRVNTVVIPVNSWLEFCIFRSLWLIGCPHMKLSPLVPVYSVTLLLSAALLFSVQPMFSKMVLPMLGGTPQVWNTCMLFFQLMLLGGYAYAHGTTRYLSIRAQAVLHVVLLLVFTVVLPIAIPDGWTPPQGEDPTLWQLSLMSVTVGGPFFVLAGSAPMLQRWFSATGHKNADNPYFLYGASNLGSMTALLAYPVVIERFTTLTEQFQDWAFGYYALIALTLASITLVWKTATAAKTPVHTTAAADPSPITWNQRFLWLFLAFVPSLLMLGVTTFITTDIAAVPLLWILPLALYVGTFIIVFANKPIITLKTTTTFQAVLLIMLIAQKIAPPVIDPLFLVGLHLFLFFFSALTCHMQLANSRPNARHLTEFYLIMSIGGALGGFFNAIIAPQFLIIPLEYVLVLILACGARYITDPAQSFSATIRRIPGDIREEGLEYVTSAPVIVICLVFLMAMTASVFDSVSMILPLACGILIALCMSYVVDKRWVFVCVVACTLSFYPFGYDWSNDIFKEVLHRDRNFFGIIKIANTGDGERVLLHGTTNHGTQLLDEKFRLTPMSYYSFNSPLRDVYSILDERSGKQQIGILGLGIGVTACFTKEGRSIDYFEINALIKEIAENREYFTFLSDCGTPYKVILGDARLTIQQEPADKYDMILSDIFTSDNIPVHVMTVEAMKIYVEKLKKDGILVMHISNRFLDLEPVLYETAKELGIPALVEINAPMDIKGTKTKSYASHWVVFARDENDIKALRGMGWSDARPRAGVKFWTDQYSNIFLVLNNLAAINRFADIAKKEAEDKAVKDKAAGTTK